MAACAACAAHRPLSETGLCVPCRDELRFVVRPEAHRETERRARAAETATRILLERFGIVTVSAYPRDNSLWLCDGCGERIPVAAEHTLIPLLASSALCPSCVGQLPFWPEGWTRPTPRACRCGACQRPLLALLART